jgi:hypothetical protein
VRQDEQRPPVFPAESQIERTFGNVNPVDRFARGVVYQYLPGSQVDIPLGILRQALAALLQEQPNPGNRAIRVDRGRVSPLLAFIRQVKRLSRYRFHQPEGLQSIPELISEGRRPLHKRIVGRNEQAAVR